jgi:hypothetical protein
MGDLRDLRKFLLYVDENKNTNSAHGIREDYEHQHINQEKKIDIAHIKELSEPDFLSEESRNVRFDITQGITKAYENRQVSAYKITLKGKKLMKNFGAFWAWVDDNDKRVNIILGFISGVLLGGIGIAIAIIKG